MAKKQDTDNGVEVYTTNSLDNMLSPRRDGAGKWIIHRATGNEHPPKCFVALSEYQRLETVVAGLKDTTDDTRTEN